MPPKKPLLPGVATSVDEAVIVTNESGIVLRLGWLSVELAGLVHAIACRRSVMRNAMAETPDEIETAHRSLDNMIRAAIIAGPDMYNQQDKYLVGIMEKVQRAVIEPSRGKR